MSEDRVWGRNPVLALLRSGAGAAPTRSPCWPGATGPLAEIVALARQAGVKVSYRTRDQLTAIAGTPEHQGVVARVAAAEYVDLEDLLAIPAQRRRGRRSSSPSTRSRIRGTSAPCSGPPTPSGSTA